MPLKVKWTERGMAWSENDKMKGMDDEMNMKCEGLIGETGGERREMPHQMGRVNPQWRLVLPWNHVALGVLKPRPSCTYSQTAVRIR